MTDMMAGSAVDHGRGRDSPAPLEHEITGRPTTDDRRSSPASTRVGDAGVRA